MSEENIILSKSLGFEGLANARDLGGMIGMDGRRIKTGKLVRSSLLCRATEKDLERLPQVVSLVVDFRSDAERKLQSDPELAGVEHVALPAVAGAAPGVTREEDSLQAVLILLNDPEKARAHMIRTYRDIITSTFSLAQYERFFRLLLEGRERAILWHCTAGKDRAGMAAFFVEKLLGVSDETLRADYMKSNDYLTEEVEQMAHAFASHGEAIHPEAVDYMFGAKIEFLDVVEQSITEHYGTYDTFFREGLHLSDEDQVRLREMYLEACTG